MRCRWRSDAGSWPRPSEAGSSIERRHCESRCAFPTPSPQRTGAGPPSRSCRDTPRPTRAVRFAGSSRSKDGSSADRRSPESSGSASAPSAGCWRARASGFRTSPAPAGWRPPRRCCVRAKRSTRPPSASAIPTPAAFVRVQAHGRDQPVRIQEVDLGASIRRAATTATFRATATGAVLPHETKEECASWADCAPTGKAGFPFRPSPLAETSSVEDGQRMERLG